MYQHTLAPRHDINCCNVTSDRSTIQEHGQEDLGEERGEGGGGGGEDRIECMSSNVKAVKGLKSSMASCI